MNRMIDSFVNYGTDELVKSYHMEQVTVHGKHGTYQAMRRKKNAESESAKVPTKVANKEDIKKVFNKKNVYMSFKTGQVTEPTEILSQFQKSNSKSLTEFLRSNYFISDGQNTTADVYRESVGKWKPQRFEAVHRPIIDKFLSESDVPPKDKKPMCFLYGGGSGSGKSTVLGKTVEPLIQEIGLKMAKVDCDSIKEMLPEYEMMRQQDDSTWAGRTHRESSDITNEVIDTIIKSGKCFQYDGTMSDFSKYQGLIKKLKDYGYEVHIVGVTIPTELAKERAKSRSRQIDDYIFEKTHKGFAKEFLNICSLEGVDSFTLYDNSEAEPRIILDDKDIYDDNLFDEFLEKGGY